MWIVASDGQFQEVLFDTREQISLDQYFELNDYCSGYYKSGTAGLDCSGYVSACYGFTSKWGTGDFYYNSLFHDINASQLGNCDIVVHPTDHIVLWKGADYGNSDHFFTYEATTSGLDKCKAYDRYWSSMSGYKCRSYF